MPDAWYYVENDEKVGPVSTEQLRRFLRSPTGGKAALVWRNGFSDWQPAGDINEQFIELADVFELPPIPRMVDTSSVMATVTENARKKARGKSVVLSLIGWLVGWIAIKAFGFTIIWPAALIGITWGVLAKCKVESAAIPMLAVMIGQTGWMMVGLAFLYANDRSTDDQMWSFLDVAVVISLSIWFVVTRSRAAVIGVLVYQICALGITVTEIGNVSLPGLSGQTIAIAEAIHLVLRATGIVLCIYALTRVGKIPMASGAIANRP
jgi:hypothetical protein